jgi:hypothetical protein
MLLALLARGLVPWGLFPVLLGVLGLTTRWRAGPLLVVLTLGALLVIDFLGELRWRRRFRPEFSSEDVVLCAATLAYLAGNYRLLGILKNILPVDPRQPPPGASASRHFPVPVPGIVSPRRLSRLIAPTEFVLVGAVGLAIAILAQTLWMELHAVGLAVARQARDDWIWRSSTGGRVRPPVLGINLPNEVWQTIVLLGVLGVAALVVASVVGYLSWRRQTPEEATLYLQDTAWYETRREQWRAQAWLIWSRQRAGKRGRDS